ncbi:NAD(P)H-dependent flavin oxidoreductase [Pseudomonas citri]|uniref:NAD(P)H-dependent flavin oxidoreductase n=1 Tax=Pseudomonas citri TaxID=2978349 RepID=UPI0021B68E3C|nr:nitronate monooxygenase [Pseudomonas citri]
MNKSLIQLLGIRHPIIQAPMVGVSTPLLAAAVTNAGGLGSLGLGGSTVEQAKALIQDTKAMTGGPLNVNLFCHRPASGDRLRSDAWIKHLTPHFQAFNSQPPTELAEIYRSFLAYEQMLDLLLEQRPEVVSFHFGVPPVTWIKALKERGIITLGCATTVSEAHEVAQAGIDVIVAQGVEAGGHRGVLEYELGEDAQIGLFALLRQVVKQINLPVIAAGGIMDGAGISAALALGAGAVQMGTAFLLCPESSTTAAHREALKSSRAADTRITRGISGRPARGLVNKLYFEAPGNGHQQAVPAEFPLAYDLSKKLHALALKSGCNDFAAQWAGQGAPLARELPAATLVQALVDELGVASSTR